MIDAMFYTHFQTKKSLKILLFLIASFSLSAPIVSYIFYKYFQMPGPIFWLSLSTYGINQGFFFQFLTYPLIANISTAFDLNLLFTLSLQLYALWFTAQELMYRFSSKSFWWILFSSVIFCAIIGFFSLLLLQPQGLVFGLTPLLFSLGTLYALAYPELNFFLLGSLRIKAKWLILIIFGISLLMTLSGAHWALFMANIAGSVWGYLIGRWILKMPALSIGRFS